MNDHLREDQFAKCAVGRPERAELLHLGECAECSGELERFRIALSLFRDAVRECVDDRIALGPLEIVPPRPDEAGMSKWHVALVAAVVLIMVILPSFTSIQAPQNEAGQASNETSPDDIMNRVNLHLSRVVPEPMEPMMSLIPGDEFAGKSGGVR